MKEKRFTNGELRRGRVGADLFEFADVRCLLGFRGHERPEFIDFIALDVKHAGAFRRIEPFVQTGAEVIATEVALFEIELGEGMRAVDDGLNAVRARHVADCFHRSDLAGDVDHVRDENESGAVGDSFFKRGGDLAEILWRNRNLNELELEIFPFFPLTQCGEHPRVVLGRGENFVAGFEVHAHQQNLKRLRRVARDRDLFAIAAEQLGQAGANGFRLRLEDLPHRVSGGVFLFPDVTNERLGHDPRAGRDAAIVQVDNAACDTERVLDNGPVVFIRGRFFRREMRDSLRRCFDVS